MRISLKVLTITVSALSLTMAQPAHASCYGNGYSRWCDGMGGSGATYSKIEFPGMTDYNNPHGTNKTVIRSNGGSIDNGYLQIIETLRYR